MLVFSYQSPSVQQPLPLPLVRRREILHRHDPGPGWRLRAVGRPHPPGSFSGPLVGETAGGKTADKLNRTIKTFTRRPCTFRVCDCVRVCACAYVGWCGQTSGCVSSMTPLGGSFVDLLWPLTRLIAPSTRDARTHARTHTHTHHP